MFQYIKISCIKKMVFGLCLGGIGLGKCGNTSSSQSTNITNTAIASAYYNNAFSCQNAISGGNRVVAGGVCSCREAGIPAYECEEWQEKSRALTAHLCDTALDKGKEHGLTGDELLCLCKGGGCNLNVDQKSIVLSQVTCKNTTDVAQKLKNNFANDLVSKMKQSMTDIGGLFDSNNQKIAFDIANRIQQQFDSNLIADVSNSVVTGNQVRADCGGLNMQITQYSYLNNVLNVLMKNKTIQSAANELTNHVKTDIDRKDKGLAGFVKSVAGLILLIVVPIVIIVVIVVVVMMVKKKQQRGY